MDARARLQRYLEQRRELGESELVLDSMSVEDVMALVGVKSNLPSSRRPARVNKSGLKPPSNNEEAPSATQAHHEAPNSGANANRDVDLGSVEPASVSSAPPAAPAIRFDPTANTAWRDVLSNEQPHTAGPSDVPARASQSVVVPNWLSEIGWSGGIAASSRNTSNRSTTDSGGIEAVLAAIPTLNAIAEHIRACQRCGLHSGARQAVPGEGDPIAELLCVGEGPGEAEDEQGRPFVGESGQLLTKILGAISLPRESVYICNVVKHRPPGNRDPLPEEVAACQPYLRRQLAIVAPRVILALGRFAAQTLLGTSEPLGRLRGKIHMYDGIPVVATYHPAALLRNAAWKRPTWEDVKMARRILDLSRLTNGDTTAGRPVD